MDVKKFCDIPFRLSCVMLQIPIKTVIKSSTVFSSLSVLLTTFYKTKAAKNVGTLDLFLEKTSWRTIQYTLQLIIIHHNCLNYQTDHGC